MTTTADARLERRLRGRAYARGFQLMKYRSRSPMVDPLHGTFQLVDDYNHAALAGREGFGCSLEEVDEFLRDREPQHLPRWNR